MRANEFIFESTSLQDGVAAAEQSGVKLMPLPGSDFKMVQIAGRPIVVVNVNGLPIPFYVSTGSGGKATVVSNQWYPFWGIGADGWFNKGSERQINSYYDSPQLKIIADVLNKTLPNALSSRSAIPDGGGAIETINAGKSPIPYKQGSASPETSLKKMDNMGKSLSAQSARVNAPAHLPDHQPEPQLPYGSRVKSFVKQIVPSMFKENQHEIA